MEIMINELSLSGQFQNKDEFLDNLEALLPSIKLIEGLGFSILKNYLFFDSEITSNEKLNDITHLKEVLLGILWVEVEFSTVEQN